MQRFKQALASIQSRGEYRRLELPRGISFYSNDYLGLSRSPEVIAAGVRALEVFGAGSGGSRLLGGHSSIFTDAEGALAQFFGAPSALFFSSGYLANLGLLTALAPCFDRVLSDEFNHASLIDGIRLSGRPKKIVPHNRWDGIETTEGDLIVSEGLFSMEGDFVDWSALVRTKGFIVLDQAHSAGLFFEDGRGIRLPWERAVSVVTFGKAFGVSGACVLGDTPVIDYLINNARSFIFSTAPSPVIPAMVLESVRILEKEPWRREALWERSRKVRLRLRPVVGDAGVPGTSDAGSETAGAVWGTSSPIITVRIRGADRALRFCENMRKIGIDLRSIRYPTVRVGEERIRLTVSLNVSEDNTLLMADELVRQWKAFT